MTPTDDDFGDDSGDDFGDDDIDALLADLHSTAPHTRGPSERAADVEALRTLHAALVEPAPIPTGAVLAYLTDPAATPAPGARPAPTATPATNRSGVTRGPAAWFVGLGLAAQIGLGGTAAAATIAAAGAAELLPGPLQRAFDSVVDTISPGHDTPAGLPEDDSFDDSEELGATVEDAEQPVSDDEAPEPTEPTGLTQADTGAGSSSAADPADPRDTDREPDPAPNGDPTVVTQQDNSTPGSNTPAHNPTPTPTPFPPSQPDDDGPDDETDDDREPDVDEPEPESDLDDDDDDGEGLDDEDEAVDEWEDEDEDEAETD